ncbi:MAG TPA: hypothetical protein VL088_14665 [Pedobacter sp.]|nr:hypothetical protein [Pedobacter sp.]
MELDIEEYIANSHHYRGWVINEFATLEKQIEAFILKDLQVMNLCGYEMQTVILDRLTFEAKRQSFKKLLEDKYLRSGFVKTNKKTFPFKPLIIELNLLNDLRNMFAHYPLNDNYRNLNKDTVISLTRYRDQYDHINFSGEEMDKIVERIQKAIIDIDSYNGELSIKKFDNLPF